MTYKYDLRIVSDSIAKIWNQWSKLESFQFDYRFKSENHYTTMYDPTKMLLAWQLYISLFMELGMIYATFKIEIFKIYIFFINVHCCNGYFVIGKKTNKEPNIYNSEYFPIYCRSLFYSQLGCFAWSKSWAFCYLINKYCTIDNLAVQSSTTILPHQWPCMLAGVADHPTCRLVCSFKKWYICICMKTIPVDEWVISVFVQRRYAKQFESTTFGYFTMFNIKYWLDCRGLF